MHMDMARGATVTSIHGMCSCLVRMLSFTVSLSAVVTFQKQADLSDVPTCLAISSDAALVYHSFFL